MKLYDSKTAPNPRRVRIFLAEKGITVPVEQVDIVSAQNRSAEFRGKNPMGTLPVLELDEERRSPRASPSVAISRRCAPHRRSWGPTEGSRAGGEVAATWNSRFSCTSCR